MEVIAHCPVSDKLNTHIVDSSPDIVKSSPQHVSPIVPVNIDKDSLDISKGDKCSNAHIVDSSHNIVEGSSQDVSLIVPVNTEVSSEDHIQTDSHVDEVGSVTNSNGDQFMDQSSCIFCKEVNHASHLCTSSTTSKIRRVLKTKQICFACLDNVHGNSHKCEPKLLCEVSCCNIKYPHSKILCTPVSKVHDQDVLCSSNSTSNTQENINRLETMLLFIENPITKQLHGLRGMLDTGASHTYIKASAIKLLNLEILDTRAFTIASFGKKEFKQCDIVKINCFGRNDITSNLFTMQCTVVDKLCSPEISHDLSWDQWEVINQKGLRLADPEAAQCGVLPIDLIIGQDFYYSLVDGNSLLLPGGLRLVHTIFDDYMLAGSAKYNPPLTSTTQCSQSASSHSISFNSLTIDEEHATLEQFASLDVLGISPEEDIHPVLADFHKKTKLQGGRYEVELPKKHPQITKLGTNFSQAFARLVSGHNKRQKKADQTEQQKYKAIIEEYLETGILERVQKLGTVQEVRQQLMQSSTAFDRVAVESAETIVHYLPHHPVYKASSGKLRVVYDAKAKPYKGAYSLNECLEKGPNMMNSLVHILLRFRKGKYAAKADVEKAFLQVLICLRDRDLLRILWLEDGVVWVYRFTRLPFGLRCAPFLLAAVMLKALSSGEIDEELRDNILASFYVDDSVIGEKTLQGLLHRRSVSIDSFNSAGMVLREWTSNDPEARAIFSKEEGRELPTRETVLGLDWDPILDTIGINYDRLMELIGKSPKTKRALWKFCNKLYDPLGLVSPYTIQAKFLTREVSRRCKGWDSKLPKDLADKVTKWMDDFVFLKDIRLPRQAGFNQPEWQRLVGFCDASSTGISACVYLVSSDGKEVMSNLIKANTHIPPEHLKGNIPKLELIGAVMLANLMTLVRKSYPEIPVEHIFYFTDSGIVLCWIFSGSSDGDIFVTNRISVVRELTTVENWGHVTSALNPADIPSRGCSLAKLKNCPLYWHGPDFIRGNLVDELSNLHNYKNAYTKNVPEASRVELKLNFVLTKQHKPTLPVANISNIVNISRYSTYNKLISVSRTVIKYLNVLDARRVAQSKESVLSVVKLDPEISAHSRVIAEVLWIQATQLAHFPDMFVLAMNNKARVPPSVKSMFCEYKLFLDPDNYVLCCGTRMENSDLPHKAIYPMLLPTKSMFTNLVILKSHKEVGHQGTPQTLTQLRLEFWVPQGRRAVQKVLYTCNHCRKVDGQFFSLPPHAPLPDFRAQRHRPFSSIGLDFIGPFTVRTQGISHKVYVLMLTCASTRAVHLEVAQTQQLNDFCFAMERFFAVRGLPNHIESDNGSSFVRCNTEFRALLKGDQVRDFFERRRINWNFYTQYTPRKGAFFERLNGIFKRVFRKSFGRKKLNFEEFRTMTYYAMSVMNDRPLTYIYSDNNSRGRALSPSMLTLGYNLLEPPHLRLNRIKDDISKKYGEQFAELERLKNLYWSDLSDEYFTGLFERHVKQPKTKGTFRAPKVGDICLLKNKKAPRRQWKLCKILGVKKSKSDGHVRECSVLTLTPANGRQTIYRRAPDFLVPLEIEPHYISDDPLVSAFAAGSDDSVQELGTQPAADRAIPVALKGKTVFVPKPPVKRFRKKAESAKGDPTWKLPVVKDTAVVPSERTLRPRSKTLGLVVKP